MFQTELYSTRSIVPLVNFPGLVFQSELYPTRSIVPLVNFPVETGPVFLLEQAFIHSLFDFDPLQKGKKHTEEQQAGFSPPSMRLFQRSVAAPDGVFQIREEKSCDDDEEDYYYSDPDRSDAEN